SKNFTVRSNISSPANSRRNSELEKLRADTKSKFEDMEKLLDNTIKNKIKSRSNATSPVKVIKHQSKHFEDSHLKNLLEQLSMTSVTIEKEIKMNHYLHYLRTLILILLTMKINLKPLSKQKYYQGITRDIRWISYTN
ncbi:hypothetical protein LY90DRAFT_622319, partial [Neocallimastix californiae]